MDKEKELFNKNGIIILNNWFSPEQLNELNQELDYYFSEISLNGSIRSQYYDKYTKIFDHTHLLKSLNFEEKMVEIAEKWNELFPTFSSEHYILTRASIKEESGAPDSILWHRDKPFGTLRNIFYLKGGEKESGQFRFMPGTHVGADEIEFAMTKEEFQQRSSNILDCEAPAGSVLFFDANGFHSNYPRIQPRRSIILTWSKTSLKESESRIMLSSNNLTPKVIRNIHLFANPEFKHFETKDYDFNPPYPTPLKTAIMALRAAFKQYVIIEIKIKIKSIINKIRGIEQKYDGSFLNKNYK